MRADLSNDVRCPACERLLGTWDGNLLRLVPMIWWTAAIGISCPCGEAVPLDSAGRGLATVRIDLCPSPICDGKGWVQGRDE